MRRRYRVTGHWANPAWLLITSSPHTGIKKGPVGSFLDSCGERSTERLDAVSDIKARLCAVVDWLFDNPDYDPKTKVIPKDQYPVLVDVTF